MPRLPPATLYLLWILTGAFALQWLGGGVVERWFALWPIGSEGVDGGGFLPWQVLTYAALHGNFIHLFFNAFMVWMLGAMLESQWGTRRYIQFVLACVVSAAVVHLGFTLLGFFPAGPALGISGLAYGLLLAYGLMYPDQKLMLLIPPVPIKAKYLVMILGGLALFMGLAAPGGVAHFAHLGGMLGGWLMMRWWSGKPPFGRKRPPLRPLR